MAFLELCAVLSLGLAAAYVLAILLRVACHFCGVEIPALGRAYATALVTSALSVIAWLAVQTLLMGGSRIDPILQFAALVAALVIHLGITVTLYMPLLGVRFDRAFSIWLVQASIFAALAVVLGCCFGMVMML